MKFSQKIGQTKKIAHNSKRAVLQNGRLLSLLVYKFCSSPRSSPSSSPWQASKQASNPPPLGGFFLGAYKRGSVQLNCKIKLFYLTFMVCVCLLLLFLSCCCFSLDLLQANFFCFLGRRATN